MASINLTKLKPGKTYVVKARAIDADGNYSQYSFGYLFTVPSAKADGTQLTAINNSVVTALAPSSSTTTGGALIAGGLDANGAAAAGALNLDSVWNNTASAIAKLTGTANTGAVVINSTGILGYQLTSTSSGQANFFLDTLAGNAYFRGTVYAASGQIGGFNIGPTSLYNTVGSNTIEMNAGNTGYPYFQVSSASSTLKIAGDGAYPYIAFDNVTSSDFSDMILRFGDIGSPDFGITASNTSRGEILFWSPTAPLPNMITIRRFAEAGTGSAGGPDGIAYIDLQTDVKSGTPDISSIRISTAQSSNTSTSNDTGPNADEQVNITLYKAFGDTSTASYPAYLNLEVKESGYSNTISMSANQTSISAISTSISGSVSITGQDSSSPQGNYSLKVISYAAGSATAFISTPAFGNNPALILQGSIFPGNLLEFKDNSASTLSYFDRYGKFFGNAASYTGLVTAASFVGNGSGLTGITASATGSVTIGSTVIGLGTTSASLGGLTNLSISTSGTSTSALTISESLSNNNLTGGTISIATSANATTATSPTGGAISITTTAGGSGAGIAGGGNITIQTSATGTGTAGAIAITSGIPGSIENMSIGVTTPRNANFSSIGATTPGTGVFTDLTANKTVISSYTTTITLADGQPTSPGLVIKNAYLNQTANLLELTTYSSPSNPLVYFNNEGNLVSSRTASFSNKVTAASFVGNGSEITLITASNVFGTVGSAASVGSTVIGGILNSSSNAFTLLATPLTINAFGGASAITIGYQANGTSLMNIGNQGNTGARTLNLFTTLGGSGGQNTINIGASGTTTVSIPQVINIGNATGAYNTITIGGATDTILNLNATASVTGKITAASLVGNGSGLTSITGANVSGTVASATNATNLGGIVSSSYALQSYANSASLNAYNSASAFTAASAHNNQSASVGYASSAGFVLGSNVSGFVASATNSSSANYASSAGYLPVSGLSASTITIGSTAIGLGNTSASLSGLSSVSASSASISGTTNAASVIATQVTGGGMDLIYSGSVASTSGSVLIDNIFSSNYANYRVTYTTLSTNSGTSIYFRYANAGVPSSSALYTYATLSNATSTTTTNSSSVIYHSVGAYALGATHVFEFYGPALTTTHMFKTEIYDAFVSGPTQQTVRGTNTNSSSFSGIVLATAAGTAFNGTVRVYGYHN